MSSPQERKAKQALAAGLACVSFAAILVRYCTAPALVIGFYRTAFASLLVGGVVLARRHREPWDGVLQKRLAPFTLGAGLLLAFHFATWIGSLQLTTVASSLVVMSTQPLWAALLGRMFLGDRVSLRGAVAMVVAMAGVGLIAWGDMGRGWSGLAGDGLALVSGLAAAAYLTVGRGLRHGPPLPHYVLAVYGTCALTLGAAAVLARQPLVGFDGRTWLMFALMALFPSFFGHSLLNYAVRHLESYRVSLSILVEPVVSTVLAALLFAEIPGPRFYFGAALVACGVILALWQPGSGRSVRWVKRRIISSPSP